MKLSSVLFPSPIASFLFYTIFILWLLGEMYAARRRPASPEGRTGKQRSSAGSGMLIYVSITILIVLSFSFSEKEIGTGALWLSYIGIVVMALGLLLRQWAIQVLGRYFSTQIKTETGQEVVRSGPYRLIRHPSYTGAIILFIGFGLGVHSWAASLLALVLLLLVYTYRIKVEEKALLTGIGEAYAEYMQTTKMLIPYIY